MTRNNTVKGMVVATIFLSILPALAYLAYYWKSVRNNTSLISEKELGVFIIIALITSLSHIGVSAAQSAIDVGGAFFMVSAFVHLTKIAALVLLYKACKTPSMPDAITNK